MKTPVLTIMCGIPRNGKSTWIKSNKENAVIVSPDEIRKEIFGHQFYAPANKFVFSIAEAMVSLLLKQGIDVIVDATHLTVQSRLAWLPIVTKYGAEARIVWVYISKYKAENLLETIKRNDASLENERLPTFTLEAMMNSFQYPDPITDSWAKIIEFQNL